MAGEPASRDHATLVTGRSRRDVITLAPSSVIAVSVGALSLTQAPAAAGRSNGTAGENDVSDGAVLTDSRRAYYRRARF